MGDFLCLPACQSLSLWEQRRRPPPVAETGRSCWGSGQQDASGSEADAGSRNPGSVTEGDGEGKPSTKEPLRSDGQALCQSDTIAVSGIRRQRPCPLSRAYARQLPQRGSHWHVGQLSSGRAKHNISETVVLRCLGQRQFDKERCPEAAALCSKARPLAPYRASVVQWKVIRSAKGSPSGRAGAKRLRGRTRAVSRLRRD